MFQKTFKSDFPKTGTPKLAMTSAQSGNQHLSMSRQDSEKTLIHNPKMNVLIINQHPQDVVGGSEIQCDLLAKHLHIAGHQVLYFAVQGRRSHYDVPYPVKSGKLKHIELKQTLLHFRPDIVYWRFNRRKFLPSILAFKRLNTKAVFAISSGSDVLKWSYRGTTRLRSSFKKLSHGSAMLRHLLTMRLHYFGYYLVDGVIAQTEAQTGHLPVRREVVIPNSVDATTTPFHWDKPFILWIGSFKSVKRPDLYIELARHFQNSGVDFLMVGQMKAPYDQLLAGSACPPNLRYLGLRPYAEVNGMLAQTLFLVQTSEIEGFPNVFIQAWLQGKPTIGLSYDPDNIVRQQRLGYISGSMAQLIQDTETLLHNAALREEIGQRAKQFATLRFTPETNIPKVEAFFREICGEQPGASTQTERQYR